MKNLLPIYYLNGGIYYRFARFNLRTLVNNHQQIINRFPGIINLPDSRSASVWWHLPIFRCGIQLERRKSPINL
jgi:hypothetical protein